MSTLVERTGRPPRPPRPSAGSGRPPARRRPVGATHLITGALGALQAATASLVVILVPVVLAWATAAFSQAPWGQVLQFGVGAWLLAHHAGIDLAAGQLGLTPLGLTAVPLVSCWLAGVRLARTLDPNAEAIRSGVGRARPRRPPTRAVMALVLSYAGLVTVAAVLATGAGVQPLVPQAFVGAAVICAIGAVTGAYAWVAGGLLPGLRRTFRRLRLPRHLGRCLSPVALAVAVQLVGAAVLLITALVLARERMLLLHDALAPGVVGSLILILAQLTMLPNLVIWAAAWTAGPGFAVGTGTSVYPGFTELGALPAVPVLGALPTPGAGPVWGWAALALPVLSGVMAGWLLLRRSPEAPAEPGSTRSVLLVVGSSAILTGAVWAVLGWLSGGPAGPGRLAEFGPSPWQLGLATALEVGLGAVLAVGVGVLLRKLSSGARPGQPDSPVDALLR